MKLLVSELKKHLNELDKKQLIQLIAELHKTDEKAQQFFMIQFNREDATVDLLEKTKKSIEKNYSMGPRGQIYLDFPKIKKEIKEFEKLSNDLEKTTDLQLYFVELGTTFTLTYGDIDERFYNDLLNIFVKVIDTCEDDQKIFEHFEDRLYKVVSKSENIGWSYGIAMERLYNSLSHLYEDE